MAYRYKIEKHATAGVSKLLATSGGAHIFNVTLDSDTDNGNIVKRGAWNGFDNYKEDTATTFNGVVRMQAANGNWYVEVLADMGTDALLVYNPPVVEAEYNNQFKSETAFFNEKGSVGRAHELKKGDIFEVSADAFNVAEGSKIEAGKTITTITDKKMDIA